MAIDNPLIVSDDYRDTISRQNGYVLGLDGRTVVGYTADCGRTIAPVGNPSLEEVFGGKDMYFVMA